MVVCKFAIGETKTGVAIHNLIDLTVFVLVFSGNRYLGRQELLEIHYLQSPSLHGGLLFHFF
jgi:hypothetical protein